jgi:phosphate-selective porin OprO and OprP
MLNLILKRFKINIFIPIKGTILFASFVLIHQLFGQDVQSDFGKGIGFASSDSSFTLAMSGRIQSMTEIKNSLNTNEADADFYIRRCRLDFQGKAFHPSFSYRIQIGFAQRDITADNSAEQNNLILRDAMLFYAPKKWLKFGFGQTKLPGNRQRSISSANLQLVERSIVNNNFTLDRDKGIWMYNTFNLGRSLFRATFAVSSGEGRINSNKNGEVCLSSRFEFLPFGAFTNYGDYIEADQEKEKKPKLSLATAFSHNYDAVRTHGQLGEYLYNNNKANIDYYGGDLLFKYRGFSFEAECYTRSSNIGIIRSKVDTNSYNSIFSGTGILFQSGMFVSKRTEIAARYAKIEPMKKVEQLYQSQQEIVLGVSRYFKKHSLKLQTDVSYQKRGSSETIIYRLSGVMTF